MALLQADVKSLEAVTAAYLSQDQVMIEELNGGKDLHTDNQIRFGLPDRGVAKVWLFRLLYGAGGYSFANDPDFASVGKNEKQWEEVIQEFYRKYEGIGAWHKAIVEEVCATGKMVVPCTGRVYEFQPYKGKYPETQIKNYAVQGLGSDVVALARVSLYNRWRKLKELDKRWKDVKLVCTVHDSLIYDFDETKVSKEELAELINNVFHDLPANFYKMFKTEFNLKVGVEILCGNTWAECK